MNKKLFLLIGVVVIIVIGTVSCFSNPKGNLIFSARDLDLPYTVKFSGQIAIELTCTESECPTELEIGDYDFYIEKEGYYAQKGSVTVSKGETAQVDVFLEPLPGLVESIGDIDESVFEKCYGDTVECGLNSEFFMIEDEDTGYMALWQGDIRRATFTKGMEENSVFVNGNTAIVYDSSAGDAYLVDFEADSRDFAFNLSGLVGIMFLGNGEYLTQTDSGIFWIKEMGEAERLYFGRDLNSVAYIGDEKIYFIEDSSVMGDLVTAEGVFVGSYDGTNYYVILDELQIDPDSAVMGILDPDQICVKDGEKEYQVQW